MSKTFLVFEFVSVRCDVYPSDEFDDNVNQDVILVFLCFLAVSSPSSSLVV